jgi:hypothetical protein
MTQTGMMLRGGLAAAVGDPSGFERGLEVSFSQHRWSDVVDAGVMCHWRQAALAAGRYVAPERGKPQQALRLVALAEYAEVAR